MVSEKGLDLLDAPIARPGARNVPMPYNDKIELATIPSRAATVSSLGPQNRPQEAEIGPSASLAPLAARST